MGESSTLDTDYLVVGAGAMGMNFVDALIDESDADVVIVDRRHRPGGHWLDSYPFVQLHQPSKAYGVNSTPLGQDRIERDGREQGFLERASGAEICGYFDEVMQHRLLTPGRVRFFPMCDHLGDGRFRSRLTGQTTEVTARRAIVDATYMASRVPATEPPPFAVADGVRCVPVGQLTNIDEPPAGFVIVGGGKTALDAACWLLDRGTPPERITWVRPRDSWLLNRAYFQPGPGVAVTFEGVVLEVEAVAESSSIDEAFAQLERYQVMLRTDPTVTPSMMRGATLSIGELDQLRRIENVVRLGHVERIDLDEIVLDHGSIPTSPDHLHVHCAAGGLPDRPPVPIFSDHSITLQVVSRVSLPLSAGMIGHLESTRRTTAEKNRLLRPNPWPHTPFDFMRHVLIGIKTEMQWQDDDGLQAWVDSSRLNLVQGIDGDPDQARVTELQGRFLTALFPALANIEQWATRASPAEQARILEPAAPATA
ncbi:MAG TPA: NAD(P)-binding protein [Microthrixaceae bacterium]|nr:NAD(P)-binding protein [Microthrixaceae bacterium]